MKEKLQNHGFKPVEITPDQYIFGSEELGGEVLVPDGQWYGYLPDIEIQKKYGLETMNCTVYGTLNCLEILHSRLFGEEVNYSERYVGVLSGTTKNGNNPHAVAETIRKESGCVEDILLPFSESINTWDKYYGPIPSQLKKLGKDWLRHYKFGHDWVAFSGSSKTVAQRTDDMKKAMRYSPLGASVYAWQEAEGVFVKPEGKSDNHWVTIYGYEDQKYWFIFDHYDTTHKRLVWDFGFEFVKRYTLEKKVPATNWFSRVLDFISNIFGI